MYHFVFVEALAGLVNYTLIAIHSFICCKIAVIISFFVFHQASQLALDGIARSLKIPPSKMVIDMVDTGNLVSASIPVVLAKLMANHSFAEGQFVVLCGFGVGLSWSTALVQF